MKLRFFPKICSLTPLQLDTNPHLSRLQKQSKVKWKVHGNTAETYTNRRCLEQISKIPLDKRFSNNFYKALLVKYSASFVDYPFITTDISTNSSKKVIFNIALNVVNDLFLQNNCYALKNIMSYFLRGPLLYAFTIANPQKVTSRTWTCTKP